MDNLNLLVYKDLDKAFDKSSYSNQEAKFLKYTGLSSSFFYRLKSRKVKIKKKHIIPLYKYINENSCPISILETIPDDLQPFLTDIFLGDLSKVNSEVNEILKKSKFHRSVYLDTIRERPYQREHFIMKYGLDITIILNELISKDIVKEVNGFYVSGDKRANITGDKELRILFNSDLIDSLKNTEETTDFRGKSQIDFVNIVQNVTLSKKNLNKAQKILLDAFNKISKLDDTIGSNENEHLLKIGIISKAE